MAFEKDYKGLYEDQLARTNALKSELADLKWNDQVSLRERVAIDISRTRGTFVVKDADEIYDWIIRGQKAQKAVNDLIDGIAKPSKQPKRRRGRSRKNPTIELSVPTKGKKKGKRKYTKRSKYWGKKK